MTDLGLPPISEDEEVDAVPDDVESETPRGEDLALDPGFAHDDVQGGEKRR
jgi:hypothetical protein